MAMNSSQLRSSRFRSPETRRLASPNDFVCGPGQHVLTLSSPFLQGIVRGAFVDANPGGTDGAAAGGAVGGREASVGPTTAGTAGSGGVTGEGEGSDALGELVATGVDDFPLGQLIVDGEHVYVACTLGVKRASIGSGEIETLTTVRVASEWSEDAPRIHTLSKIGANVYFTTGEGVLFSVPETGGGHVPHAGHGPEPFDGLGLATDGSDLFWAGKNHERRAVVLRVRGDQSSCHEESATIEDAGCTADRCATGQMAGCWENASTVDLACCTESPLFASMQASSYSEARRVVVADGYVYWTEVSLSESHLNQTWVVRQSTRGGSQEVLARESRTIASPTSRELEYLDIAVSGELVYFTRIDFAALTEDGRNLEEIRSVSLGSGTVQTVVAAPLAAGFANGVLGVVPAPKAHLGAKEQRTPSYVNA